MKAANEYVETYHRHHKRSQGHKFSIGLVDEDETLLGVCTDGSPNNACSMLYAAARRASFGMGYRRIGTYILQSEPGTSLRASGWKKMHTSPGGKWTGTTSNGKERNNVHPLEPKVLYESVAGE